MRHRLLINLTHPQHARIGLTRTSFCLTLDGALAQCIADLFSLEVPKERGECEEEANIGTLQFICSTFALSVAQLSHIVVLNHCAEQHNTLS